MLITNRIRAGVDAIAFGRADAQGKAEALRNESEDLLGTICHALVKLSERADEIEDRLDKLEEAGIIAASSSRRPVRTATARPPVAVPRRRGKARRGTS